MAASLVPPCLLLDADLSLRSFGHIGVLLRIPSLLILRTLNAISRVPSVVSLAILRYRRCPLGACFATRLPGFFTLGFLASTWWSNRSLLGFLHDISLVVPLLYWLSMPTLLASTFGDAF
ncbi:hypothetical protein GOP47_0008776 [Adiantum capillus-veneris]|uniref:Uncharacterized protein n=1 Tax=Adiantum capillus-veneris TaxID=13818 RepID=A0A9D4UZ02_ADICA|nr:hypothetical protein GOP47_0008776 [Adiantum capillus-veneris]